MGTASVVESSSLASTDRRLAETVRRVNARAHDLLTRQAEINRRIRCLRKVMRGLRDLSAPSSGCGAMDTPARAALALSAGHDSSGALRRACRIALMEGAGAASLQEIRSRITRRGSFADFGFTDATLIQTLRAMTGIGEVDCLEMGSLSCWQRLSVAEEWTFSRSPSNSQGQAIIHSNDRQTRTAENLRSCSPVISSATPVLAHSCLGLTACETGRIDMWMGRNRTSARLHNHDCSLA
jgi:hypothetical protein